MQLHLVPAFRAALFITVIAIAWLAFTSHPPVTATQLPDKINHLAAFFVLGFLLDYSFPGSGERLSRLWLAKAGALLAYAVGIECVQWFLAERSFELLDIAADAVGILLYLVLMPLGSKIPMLQQLRAPAPTLK